MLHDSERPSISAAVQTTRIATYSVSKVLKPNPTSRTEAIARLFDATQEAWVTFEAVFEPVFLGLKADQYAGRFAMARDDDLLGLGLTKIVRQIVLNFREWNFPHSGLPNCASHASASDFATIARIWTVVPDTS